MNDSVNKSDYDYEVAHEEHIIIIESDGISSTAKSSFYKIVQDIALEWENCVKNEMGDHDYLYFLPAISPLLLKLCTYIPLWSGVMCKLFNYGDNPPSSTAIESQFNDLKNRVLKHVNYMPMRIDDFLKIHIQSINGTMKCINA